MAIPLKKCSIFSSHNTFVVPHKDPLTMERKSSSSSMPKFMPKSPQEDSVMGLKYGKQFIEYCNDFPTCIEIDLSNKIVNNQLVVSHRLFSISGLESKIPSEIPSEEEYTDMTHSDVETRIKKTLQETDGSCFLYLDLCQYINKLYRSLKTKNKYPLIVNIDDKKTLYKVNFSKKINKGIYNQYIDLLKTGIDVLRNDNPKKDNPKKDTVDSLQVGDTSIKDLYNHILIRSSKYEIRDDVIVIDGETLIENEITELIGRDSNDIENSPISSNSNEGIRARSSSESSSSSIQTNPLYDMDYVDSRLNGEPISRAPSITNLESNFENNPGNDLEETSPTPNFENDPGNDPNATILVSNLDTTITEGGGLSIYPDINKKNLSIKIKKRKHIKGCETLKKIGNNISSNDTITRCYPRYSDKQEKQFGQMLFMILTNTNLNMVAVNAYVFDYPWNIEPILIFLVQYFKLYYSNFIGQYDNKKYEKQNVFKPGIKFINESEKLQNIFLESAQFSHQIIHNNLNLLYKKLTSITNPKYRIVSLGGGNRLKKQSKKRKHKQSKKYSKYIRKQSKYRK